MNKSAKFIEKLAAEVSPKYVGSSNTSQGKAIAKSFPGLPANSTVSTDTSFVAGKPVGVLNTAKTQAGREFVNTQNLQTGKSTTGPIQKGTLPNNSYFDGTHMRTQSRPIQPLK